ncbi:GGDEF domain-containing protein [Firmicutes bacterium AM10-47]|nr:GGDEF domain-containing protein [Firmicutes bacterium AM10-47]
MKKLWDWVKNVWVYSGLSKENYENIQQSVAHKNARLLKNAIRSFEVLTGVLLIAVFFFSQLNALKSFLILTFIGMMMMEIIIRVCDLNNFRTLRSVCYVFLSIVYLFAAVSGTVGSPKQSAILYFILLFVGPLLFIDKPYRMSLFLCIMTVIFRSFALHYKEPEIANFDVLNAIIYTMLAILLYLLTSRTKADEHRLRWEIAKQRDTDELTKLLTKNAIERKIKRYMELTPSKPAMMLVIDLDNFKHINDTFGHAYGDAVLRLMGECIRSNFREDDYKGRFGGDEFVVFLPGIDDKQQVVTYVNNLVEMMKTRVRTPESANPVHGSIGIALYPKHASTYEELFKKADEALYASKERGKDRYTFYIPKEVLK